MELKNKPVLKKNAVNERVGCTCGCMGNRQLSIPDNKKLMLKSDKK